MPKPAVDPTLTKIITVRLTPEEFDRLLDAATARGMTYSALVRRIIFAREFPDPRPPRVDLEAVQALNRNGVLLNQLIAIFHRWISVEQTPESKEALFQMYRFILALRDEVFAVRDGLR